MDDGKNSACRVRALPARDFEEIIKKCLIELGQNKALIESSIRNASQFNKKRLKPLQEEVNKIKNLLAKTTVEVNRLIKIMKSDDMVVKEITDWGFDPTKEKAPTERGAFITKIRTIWFKIKLSLYQIPEIETFYRSLSQKKLSSDFHNNWLPKLPKALPLLPRV